MYAIIENNLKGFVLRTMSSFNFSLSVLPLPDYHPSLPPAVPNG